MNRLELRSLVDSDLPLLESWLNKDYILKWYENPAEWLTEIRGRFDAFRFIRHFIAIYDGNPIGFCQYYPCSHGLEDWYGNVPLEGTYSIDYLIGEESHLGKGLSKEMIGLLVEKVFALPDAKRIIVQPDQQNTLSCKALCGAGFVFDEGSGVYFLMEFS